MHTYIKNYLCRRRGRGPEEEDVNLGNYSGSGEKLKKKMYVCRKQRTQLCTVLLPACIDSVDTLSLFTVALVDN